MPVNDAFDVIPVAASTVTTPTPVVVLLASKVMAAAGSSPSDVA